MAEAPRKQLLHLVIGGELSKRDATEFKDLDKVDLVGVYPNYATAYVAWRAKAQQTPPGGLSQAAMPAQPASYRGAKPSTKTTRG